MRKQNLFGRRTRSALGFRSRPDYLIEVAVPELRGRGFGTSTNPDPAWDRGSGPLDARKATLLEVVEETGSKTLTHL